MGSGREMVHLLHFSPRFLNCFLVFQQNFEHLFGAGDAASDSHMKFSGNPLQLHRTVFADTANNHCLAPVRFVDGHQISFAQGKHLEPPLDPQSSRRLGMIGEGSGMALS